MNSGESFAGTLTALEDEVGLWARMRLPPYRHQASEFERRRAPARALFWQQRTGKSKLIIDQACALYLEGLLDGVLVVAPNGVHGNWVWKELPKHHWEDVAYAAHAWRFSDDENDERFRAFLEDAALCGGLAWLTVNLESLIRDEVLRAVNRFRRLFPRHMLVFDEAHHFGRAGSKRTARARAWARKAAFRRILTGTPVEESPLRAFSQFELLEKGALGFTRYQDFEARYAVYERRTTRGGRSYPTIKEYQNLDELKERIAQYASVVLREDCEDLPPLIRTSRYVEPTPQQLRLYRAILTRIEEDLERVGLYDAVQGGERLIKLQQVLSNFVIGDDGRVNAIAGPNPKLEALMDEVDEVGDGKTLVWCQFTEDIRRVCVELEKRGIPHVQYHGKMKGSKDREAGLRRFEAYRGRMVFVGQPEAGGEGLTIPAQKIVWYSHTAKARVRAQADERATIAGGGAVAVVDLEVHGSIDTYLLALTERKRDLADDVARHGLRAVLERVRL